MFFIQFYQSSAIVVQHCDDKKYVSNMHIEQFVYFILFLTIFFVIKVKHIFLLWHAGLSAPIQNTYKTKQTHGTSSKS